MFKELKMENKRRFTRIIFSTPASLQINGKLYETTLIDLSLKGALIELPKGAAIEPGLACDLDFKLSGSDVHIEMLGEVSHIESNTIGVQCKIMELESASHLRRLIELNVGSEELLHRELDNLSHPEE